MSIKVDFINIVDLSEQIQLDILKWRNHEDTRKVMFNDKVITVDEHKTWLNSLIDSKDKVVSVLFINNTPVLVSNVINIDYSKKVGTTGNYINPIYKGLGFLFAYYSLNFTFDTLMVDKLNSEVLSNNLKVLGMNKKLGYKEIGVKNNAYVRDNKSVSSYQLELTKANWSISRDKYSTLIKDSEKLIADL